MNSQKKILFVEDDDLTRELYLDILKKEGFLVVGAANGKEAFERLNQANFDLVLLDIMLPDTNGLAILQSIKQNPKTQEMKVVMVSNLGQDSVVREAYKFGANGYFVKVQLTPPEVVEQVKKYLE